MKRLYFGTDGIRGKFGGPVINADFAFQLGGAVGQWLQANRPRTADNTVLIGRDTRSSGALLVAAVAAGLKQAGWQVRDLGVVPTPAVSRAVKQRGAALGVMVTASHNPAEDNGIKFFNAQGVKLTDNQEHAIEQALTLVPQPGTVYPQPELLSDAGPAYIAAASALLPAGALQGWRIVLDTANGATCATSPTVLRALGAEVVGIGDAPNGSNINANVGSEHPEALAARVVVSGARLGVAHDGDGDRCVLCDERGEVLDGDEVLTMLATYALAQGRLVKRTLVVTVQSNLGVDAAVAAAGGQVLRTDVGDRYVSEKMLAHGAMLGGESSGHVICAEVAPTGDGLVAALKVIEVMLATGRPLSNLRKVLQKFPQGTLALRVKDKRPLETLPAVTAVIAELEHALGTRGRLLVRYSGTESKLRLLVEGPNDAVVAEGLARLEKAVRADLEVV
ncbi:MAG: phosphoglucosamine mutase [Opitutaceae bacterium]